jgi:hypothetical protein
MVVTILKMKRKDVKKNWAVIDRLLASGATIKLVTK